VKTAFEMTYTVSGGALNSAQSNPLLGCRLCNTDECRTMVEDIRRLKQLSLDEESVSEDVASSAKCVS